MEVIQGPETGIWEILTSPGLMMTSMSPLEATLRLAIALVLGTLMGLDREMKRKPVGLRPIAMVCLGAAAFTLITLEMGSLSLDREGLNNVDISRVIQGIVGGIGFLGAGALIRGDNGHVRGAATGAGIWVAGAVGIACGMGALLLACLVSTLCVIAQLSLGIARTELREDIEGDKEPGMNGDEE